MNLNRSFAPSMFGGRFLFAECIALLVLVLLSGNSHAKIKSRHCDPPSSCGNIQKITYPFRLKGDPENCGYKNYELACENNRSVLYLFSGKYYVEAINYSNNTIRLVDVGIHKDNCSSLPLYSLTWYNFSSADPYGWFDYYTSSAVLIVNCDNPVKSPLYLDTTGSCIKQEASSSSSSSNSSVKGHSYVLVGQLHLSDVADLCRVEKVVIKPAALLLLAGGENGRNFSFLDVHNALAYGFELRWYSTCINYTYSFPDWSSIHCLMDEISLYLRIFWSFAVMALIARTFCGMACMSVFLIYKFRRRHLSMFDGIEGFLRSQNNLMPISYSYSEIKVMTKGFRDKLGEGGYGCVYKGTLRSGNIVAIKILGKSKANGQEFINEVATIGRIHHINVVRLIGYCAERSKRALVYDFMPNGSLEKYIFSQEGNISLSCEQMYEISLGVARGIEYLHRGCDMQILHFDIKPHNILLDQNFTPKVSDFGLAKLYSTDDSIVSLTAARGTMGYMAPELFYKNIGGVSYKADVYSFGMLLMEMAGRRRNLNALADHTSQIYFPSWVYDEFIEGRDIEMGEITDEGKGMVKKMIIVGLWCIQMKPSDRPSMSKVVEMLEGNVELLQMPPKPFLCPQEIPAEDPGIDSNPTEPLLRPQEIMPAEDHGMNMNPADLSIVSGDCTNSTILDDVSAS